MRFRAHQEKSLPHSPFPLPSPPLVLPFIPLMPRSGPVKPARGLGKRCKLSQWGLGRSPSRHRFWGGDLNDSGVVDNGNFLRFRCLFCRKL